jgi:hypothetical protein
MNVKRLNFILESTNRAGKWTWSFVMQYSIQGEYIDYMSFLQNKSKSYTSLRCNQFVILMSFVKFSRKICIQYISGVKLIVISRIHGDYLTIYHFWRLSILSTNKFITKKVKSEIYKFQTFLLQKSFNSLLFWSFAAFMK